METEVSVTQGTCVSLALVVRAENSTEHTSVAAVSSSTIYCVIDSWQEGLSSVTSDFITELIK